MNQEFQLCTGIDGHLWIIETGKSKGSKLELADISPGQYIQVELKLELSRAVEIVTMSDQVEAPPPRRYFVRGQGNRLSSRRHVETADKATSTEELTKRTAASNSDFDHFKRHATLCFQKNLTLPRRIFLDANFKKNHPELSTDLDFYKLVNFSPPDKSIILPCYNCSELNYDMNSYRKSVFSRNERSYHWVCNPCYVFCKRNETDHSRFAHAALVLEYDIYKIVQFFCVWGCATPLNYTDIFKHESTCVSQPSQPCPVFGCAFRGKLFEMEKHFSEKHPSPLFFSLRSTFLTKVDRNKRNIFQWYVWTAPFFVLVKFSWELSHWAVSTSMCGTNSAVEPECLLFDKDWNFLQCVGNRKVYLDEREDLRIKCYIR